MKKDLSLLSRNKAPRRSVRIPTPQSLQNAALFYLSRYAASEASLRRVLNNRIRRASIAHREFAADAVRRGELNQAIDRIVAAHKRSGAVNDDAIADMKVAGLRRAGKSQRFIREKLSARGLATSVVARALADHDTGAEGDEADRQAALILCRKRRIGPFAPPNRRTEADRKKAYGILARAGFSSSIIRKLLTELCEGDISDEFIF